MKKLLILALLVIIVVTIAILVIDLNECERMGGTFVRGLYWYECLGK